MYNTKEEIKDRITLLETYVTDSNNTAKNYAEEISRLMKALEDIDKPVINDSVLDNIYAIVLDHAESTNEIDVSECDFDFALDYDGRVYVDSMQVQQSQEYFAEALYNDLKTLFKVIEKKDEDKI